MTDRGLGLDPVPVEHEPHQLREAPVAAATTTPAHAVAVRFGGGAPVAALVRRRTPRRPGRRRRGRAARTRRPAARRPRGRRGTTRCARADLALDLDHRLVRVEEDDVDREAHEAACGSTTRAAARRPRPRAGGVRAAPRSRRTYVSATRTDSQMIAAVVAAQRQRARAARHLG